MHIHGELSEDEEAAFQAGLSRDSDLQAGVEQLRKVDHVLAALVSESAATEDALVEKLMEEIGEPEGFADQGVVAKDSSSKPAGRIIDWVSSSVAPRRTMTVIAAAACLIIIANVFILSPSSYTTWQPTETVAIAYRGDDGPSGQYSSGQLVGFAEEVQSAIDMAIKGGAKGLKSKPLFELEMVITELPDGLLHIEVVHSDQSQRLNQWEKLFNDPSDMRQQVDAFGQSIAASLLGADGEK